MAYPRFVRSRQIKKARRTSTDITLNSTAWANLDTGLDLVLNEVQVGDEIMVGISAFFGAEAVNGYIDAVTLVGGTPTNSVARAAAVEASPGTVGVSGWIAAASAFSVIGSPVPYTVVAGDIVSNAVTFRWRYATSSAANRTLRATTSQPLVVWAMNLGPAQT